MAEPVTVDGYFGRFVIESKYGRFSVLGRNMLAERVNELRAIEALLQVQLVPGVNPTSNKALLDAANDDA